MKFGSRAKSNTCYNNIGLKQIVAERGYGQDLAWHIFVNGVPQGKLSKTKRKMKK